MSKKIKLTYLAAVGDVNDNRTWSGIPFYEFLEGKSQQVIDYGLNLDPFKLSFKLRRLLWNFKTILFHFEKGGFQYSNFFLERLWSSINLNLDNSIIINCYQLYPNTLIKNRSVYRCFHIDATLKQLFESYGLDQTLGLNVRTNAINREISGYNAAYFILVHSSWVANSLIKDYGVNPKKVFVVTPGANIDYSTYSKWEASYVFTNITEFQSLKLVFVGKDPVRKGLDRLLRAMIINLEMGVICSLRIIGCDKSAIDKKYWNVPNVEWIGFVDKNFESEKYIKLVSDCHVGCLLSTAEAGGIVLREFHALGLAVMGPDIGGSPDHVINNASILVSPNATDSQIANILRILNSDREQLNKMRFNSWLRRSEVSWKVCVQKIGHILDELKSENTLSDNI